MALLDWKNEYSVDIQSIDKQHKKLFDMINQLHDAMKSGVGAKLVPVILNSLVSYTRDHFANEENLMRQAAYPTYANHKAEHEQADQRGCEIGAGHGSRKWRDEHAIVGLLEGVAAKAHP